jgi:hypothetical protein
MNKHSSSFNCSNVYDVWVIKRLCSKAYESEFDNLWQRLCGKSTIRGMPNIYEPG